MGWQKQAKYNAHCTTLLKIIWPLAYVSFDLHLALKNTSVKRKLWNCLYQAVFFQIVFSGNTSNTPELWKRNFQLK